MPKVFVYGTLLNGYYNHEIYLKNKCEYIGEGFIVGSIYKLKGHSYPAFIENNRGMVHGECYEVSNEVLSHMDELEEYDPDNESNSLYIRKLLPIFDKEKRVKEECYVYVYNHQNEKFGKDLGDKICDGYFKM